MKILILGSAGQIGNYLKDYFFEKEFEVIEFDKVNSNDQDLTLIPNLLLEESIKKADFIFFLAFDVGGSRYLQKYQDTYEFINNNSRLMVNTFDYIKKFKKKFVFASSQMSNMSFSTYGVLKKLGELYTESLGGLIVKFWNVYGIENDMEKAHVITDFIRKGFEEGNFKMLTNGLEERDFLYAEDCCKALEAVMNNYDKLSSKDPLHITSFEFVTIRKIAEIIEKLFKGINKEIKITPSQSQDAVQKLTINLPDKLILKYWNPTTSIDQGISKVFNSMKKNYL